MGMLDFNDEALNRKNDYLKHWEILNEEEEGKEDNYDRYGSHYSNALYVTYYLVRVFPFAYMRIELQGINFDDPNRLFNNLAVSFDCASTQKSDLRELIPEFFCFPEMFYNYNNFNLGEIKNNETNQLQKVENVVLPKWCNNNGYSFIKKQKELLESIEIGEKINQWINIIFGFQQKGPEARKIHNLFNEQSYEDFEKIYDNNPPEEQNFFCRMIEFGITPNQLFKNEINKRIEISCKKLFDGKEVIKEDLENNIIGEYPYKVLYINKEKKKKNIYILNYNGISKYSRETQKETINNDLIGDLGDGINNIYSYDENKKSLKYLESINLFNPKYGVRNIESPIQVFNSGKSMIIGGFWNGNLLLRNIETERGEIIIYTTLEYSPVINIIMDKSETFAICANKNGTIFIYDIDSNNKSDWELYKIISDNFCEISCMNINENLNLFVTCSIEGYCMLYYMPDFKLFNSFLIDDDIIDFVLISQSPLPCFIFYLRKKRSLLFYSINGHLLRRYELDYKLQENYIKIYRDNNFNDYLLIYNEKNMMIELYNIIDFTLIMSSKKIEYNLIDFCISDEMDNILLLVKDDEEKNCKLVLLKDKDNKISWE